MAPTLDTTFAALSDPTRRAILMRLTQGEATVTQNQQLEEAADRVIEHGAGAL